MAVTSYARARSGLTDAQTSSLYHSLLREGRNAKDPGPVGHDRLIAGLDRQVAADNNVKPAQKARIRAALAAANPDQTDGPRAYASRRLNRSADQARAALDNHWEGYARDMGVPTDTAKQAADGHLRDALTGGRHVAAPDKWVAANKARLTEAGIPTDRGTMYAIYRTDQAREKARRSEPTRRAVTLTPVKSSAIRAMGYDPRTGRCEVEMHSRPGQPYAYRMDADDYKRFRAAPSLGAHFARHVARNPDYAYPDEQSWKADQDVRKCRSCGQWAGASHSCPVPATSPPADQQGRRVFRADGANVTTRNAHEAAWQARLTGQPQPVPVTGVVNDTPTEGTHQVTGEVHVRWANGTWRVGASNGSLNCACGTARCPHRQQVVDTVSAGLTDRAPQNTNTNTARTAASDAAKTEHAAAAARRAALTERPAAEVMYGNDMDAFNDDYQAALQRRAAGMPVVTYERENALNGMSDRGTGRGFGVELEFSLPGNLSYDEKTRVRNRIAADLHRAGLSEKTRAGMPTTRAETTDSPTGWRVVIDESCDGEVISPILYDDRTSWDGLERVCAIVRSHGGTVTEKTGTHVHVSTFDYDHTVENHTRLATLWRDNQDTMFRLGTDPERGTHRGTQFCLPHTLPSEGFSSWDDLAGWHEKDRKYGALNLTPAVRKDTTNGHVEFRAWDGSLDPGVIQARVKLSVASVDTAFRDRSYQSTGPEVIGLHAAARRSGGPGRAGWEDETASVRRLADTLFTRATDKAQLAALFAVTSWVDNKRDAA